MRFEVWVLVSATVATSYFALFPWPTSEPVRQSWSFFIGTIVTQASGFFIQLTSLAGFMPELHSFIKHAGVYRSTLLLLLLSLVAELLVQSMLIPVAFGAGYFFPLFAVVGTAVYAIFDFAVKVLIMVIVINSQRQRPGNHRVVPVHLTGTHTQSGTRTIRVMSADNNNGALITPTARPQRDQLSAWSESEQDLPSSSSSSSSSSSTVPATFTPAGGMSASSASASAASLMYFSLDPPSDSEWNIPKMATKQRFLTVLPFIGVQMVVVPVCFAYLLLLPMMSNTGLQVAFVLVFNLLSLASHQALRRVGVPFMINKNGQQLNSTLFTMLFTIFSALSHLNMSSGTFAVVVVLQSLSLFVTPLRLTEQGSRLAVMVSRTSSVVRNAAAQCVQSISGRYHESAPEPASDLTEVEQPVGVPGQVIQQQQQQQQQHLAERIRSSSVRIYLHTLVQVLVQSMVMLLLVLCRRWPHNSYSLPFADLPDDAVARAYLFGAITICAFLLSFLLARAVLLHVATTSGIDVNAGTTCRPEIAGHELLLQFPILTLSLFWGCIGVVSGMFLRQYQVLYFASSNPAAFLSGG